nr:helix-turn-helix transcriptional regulator [Enterococcus innesii]
MEFHRVLKEKRKEFGLTQEELAEKLQVSRSAI